MPSDAFLLNSGTPLTNSVTTRVSVPTTAARPPTSTSAVASERGNRARSNQPTAGASRAESSSAMINGMMTTRIVPMTLSRA